MGQKRRKKAELENLFEDVDQVDMMMQQVLDAVIDAGQPLVEGDSEDLLEVSGLPIRVEIRLDQSE